MTQSLALIKDMPYEDENGYGDDDDNVDENANKGGGRDAKWWQKAGSGDGEMIVETYVASKYVSVTLG